jgi:hypothetical protein
MNRATSRARRLATGASSDSRFARNPLDMYRRMVPVTPKLGERDRAIRQPETARYASEQACECAPDSPMDISIRGHPPQRGVSPYRCLRDNDLRMSGRGGKRQFHGSSPLRGEGARRAVEGVRRSPGIRASRRNSRCRWPRTPPLTPTLSPEGRGREGAGAARFRALPERRNASKGSTRFADNGKPR